MPENSITGIFSHLAAAEELDSPYTMHQLAEFERALTAARPILERQGIAPLRHIAASAAAMLWPQTRLDHGAIRYRALRAMALAANARSMAKCADRPASRPIVPIADRRYPHDPRRRLSWLRPNVSRTARNAASGSFPSATRTAYPARSPIVELSPSTERSARSSAASR